MIFLDANIILSHLTEPTSDETRKMKEVARNLFQKIVLGQEEVTMSEVVLHEVCHILPSSNHYRMVTATVVDILQSLIAMPGMIFP